MILERRPDDYTDRNLLLQLTLGMLSASERLHRLLDRHAPEGPPSDEPSPAPGAMELALLGAISTSRTLSRALEGLPDPPSSPPPEADEPLGDLLR